MKGGEERRRFETHLLQPAAAFVAFSLGAQLLHDSVDDVQPR